MSLKHWRCGEYANQSERRAAEYLTARLQGAVPNVEWVLLTNYASSAGSQHLADNIDMLVVSSLGVSAVEIKHWGAADLKLDRLCTPRRRVHSADCGVKIPMTPKGVEQYLRCQGTEIPVMQIVVPLK